VLIQFKDVDDWKVADFMRYIKSRCEMRDISFEANEKQSYMILGKTFKLLKLNNKSKGWLKKQIDMFLESETTTEVRSLLFINYLTRTFPRKLNDNTIKNLPKVIEISSSMKRKLAALRTIK
jgi:hypothetical protein